MYCVQKCRAFEWDVAPSPRGSAGRAVLISGNPSHALAAGGKNQERAWDFLRWWITRQNHKQVVLPGNTPTRLAAAREWAEEERKTPPPRSIGLAVEAAKK